MSRRHGGELPSIGFAGTQGMFPDELIGREVHAVVARRHHEALQRRGSHWRLE